MVTTEIRNQAERKTLHTSTCSFIKKCTITNIIRLLQQKHLPQPTYLFRHLTLNALPSKFLSTKLDVTSSPHQTARGGGNVLLKVGVDIFQGRACTARAHTSTLTHRSSLKAKVSQREYFSALSAKPPSIFGNYLRSFVMHENDKNDEIRFCCYWILKVMDLVVILTNLEALEVKMFTC